MEALRALIPVISIPAVAAAWRRFARPGLLAFLACLPVSIAVHYLGVWSA